MNGKERVSDDYLQSTLTALADARALDSQMISTAYLRMLLQEISERRESDASGAHHDCGASTQESGEAAARTPAELMRPQMMRVEQIRSEVHEALNGRMVRVVSDHNGQCGGRSRKSWRGQERKIVGISINPNHAPSHSGLHLILEGHESGECFIPANEVEFVESSGGKRVES